MHVPFERGIGPDLERGLVGADACEGEGDRHVEVCRKARRRLARGSRENAQGLGDVFNPDVVFGEIRRAGQTAHRLAGDHAHGADFAFGGGRYRIEADERAGWNDDLAAMLAREADKVLIGEQGAATQHDDGLPARKNGSAMAGSSFAGAHSTTISASGSSFARATTGTARLRCERRSTALLRSFAENRSSLQPGKPPSHASATLRAIAPRPATATRNAAFGYRTAAPRSPFPVLF